MKYYIKLFVKLTEVCWGIVMVLKGIFKILSWIGVAIFCNWLLLTLM